MMLGDTLYDAGRLHALHCMVLGDTLHDAGRYTV